MSRLRNILLLAVVVIVTACSACGDSQPAARRAAPLPDSSRTAPINSPLVKQLVAAAVEQTTYTFRYDPSYVALKYPGGDVPLERGVCSDVIIRAFRHNGVDLQKEVHEDMARNFSAYPRRWGLNGPDTNIDHRRVPNLMTFFARRGKALPITNRAEDYLPGDIVAWQLDGGLPHIGMMTNFLSDTGAGFQVVHHIGGGVRVEDVLFNWRITGHYRYFE